MRNSATESPLAINAQLLSSINAAFFRKDQRPGSFIFVDSDVGKGTANARSTQPKLADDHLNITALHKSPFGTKRQFAALHQFGRNRR